MKSDDLPRLKSQRISDIQQIRAVVHDRHFDHLPFMIMFLATSTEIREAVDRNFQSRMEFGPLTMCGFTGRNRRDTPVGRYDL